MKTIQQDQYSKVLLPQATFMSGFIEFCWKNSVKTEPKWAIRKQKNMYE